MLLIPYLISQALFLTLLLLARIHIARFLKRHSRIEDRQDLQAFMKMVRQQMYMAIVGIVLSFPTAILLCFVLLTHITNPAIVAIVIALNIGFFTLAQINKKLEERCRNLPCATSELEQAYGKVGQSWVKDTFPKF